MQTAYENEKDLFFERHMSRFFCVQWFKVKGGCSFLLILVAFLTITVLLYFHPKKKEKKRNTERLEDKFEDTKGVIRIRTSKKDRQHNGQKTPKG